MQTSALDGAAVVFRPTAGKQRKNSNQRVLYQSNVNYFGRSWLRAARVNEREQGQRDGERQQRRGRRQRWQAGHERAHAQARAHARACAALPRALARKPSCCRSRACASRCCQRRRQRRRRQGGNGRRTTDVVGGIALVLLAKAHLALAAALGHAHVIDHEQVDLNVVCAAPADLHVGCKRNSGLPEKKEEERVEVER